MLLRPPGQIKRGFAAVATYLALQLAPASAETVILEPSKDNSIFSDRLTNSNGQGPDLFVGHNAPEIEGGGIRRSLIAFDPLASIPIGATIQSVSLTLYFETAGRGFVPGQTNSLYRVTSDWGEGDSLGGGGQGVPAEPGDATWNNRFHDDTPWSTPGGDFVPTPSASLFVPAVNDRLQTWPSTPELVADVQGWVDSPSCNFGWIIRGDEVGDRTAARFTSGDEPFFLENRPMLTIDYTAPAPRLDGDLDFDGDVDRDDAARLVTNLGRDDCVTMNDGDFTTDGAVGLEDLLLLQSNIGNSLPPGGAAAVPEPQTWLLGGMMALFLLWYSRGRHLLKFAP
jgi:hypothetical protein